MTTDPRGGCAEAQQLTVNVLTDMGLAATTLQPGLVRPTPSTDTTAPTGAIESAQIDPGAGELLVSGTADDDGGVVASVEISWDGGGRWHPAELEGLRASTRWTLHWGGENWQRTHGRLPPPPEARHTPLWLRLSDDSGNGHTSEFADPRVWKDTGSFASPEERAAAEKKAKNRARARVMTEPVSFGTPPT